MKNTLSILITILSVTACTIKSPENEILEVDKEMLLRNVQVLSHDSLAGRFFGTEGNYKAQKFIADQFSSLGIAPAFSSGSIQNFDHTFQGRMRQWMFPIENPAEDFSNVPDTTITGGNVVTMIKGATTDNAIVITAHLDHLGIRKDSIYNGADDNASGVAALIAIADYFNKKEPNHTLIFAAVDAEEVGFHGVEYLLDNFPIDLSKVVLNINMDMISHNDSSELYAVGLFHNPDLKEPLQRVKSDITLLYGHDNPDDEELDDWTFSSDHAAFHKREIPFIYFGVEDHPDYHQHTDTFENINPDFYVEATRLIIRAIKEYDVSLLNEDND